MSDDGWALITGASAGLGTEYARLFAAAGHRVVLVARRQDRLEALATTLRADHDVDVRVMAADLSDRDAVRDLHRRLTDDGVTVEYLVNNAGFGQTGAFIDLDVDGALGQVDVNIAALTHLCGLYLPEMAARGRGRVLNIASTAGFQPGPYMAVYYATKAYVISFSEAVAHELKGTGVTVTAHCPGPTATEFSAVSGNDQTTLFKKGSVATAHDCAVHGYKAMMAGKSLSVHGVTNSLLTQSVRVSPRSWVRAITAMLNRPGA